MTIGDIDATPLISQTVITGGWPDISQLSLNIGFVHAVKDIYVVGFCDGLATQRDCFIATVRVAGDGTVTAASLAFHSFALVGDPVDPKIQLHKLSEGIVAVFFGAEATDPGLSLKTFSINASTGAITVVDGADVLDGTSGGIDSPGPYAARIGASVWGCTYRDVTSPTKRFVTVSLTDAGIIGSVLDGPDDTGETITFYTNLIYLDQNVALVVYNPGAFGGPLESETFTVNETTGIFDFINELNQNAGPTEPVGPKWIGHVDPLNPAAREIFCLGDESTVGGPNGLAYISINASDVITVDDFVDAGGTGEGRARGLSIGERKVFFYSGSTGDDCFVWVAAANGTLTQHDSATGMGVTGPVSAPHPLYLEGSQNSKVVIFGADTDNDDIEIVVIGVQTGLDASGRQAVWHGHDF